MTLIHVAANLINMQGKKKQKVEENIL